ncbi:MAG: RDD family protein [Burkholderiales bacterium]
MQPPLAAALGTRLVSVCYEALLLTAVLLAAALPYVVFERASGLAHVRIAFQLYLFLTAGAYFVWHWSHGGQTLAMKTWHVRLVTRSGAAVSSGRAAARYVLAALGLLAFGAGFAWAAVDPDRQFLHDRLAATRMVRADGA